MIYILLIIALNPGEGNNILIEAYTRAFETEERCQKNVPYVKEQLKDKYARVEVTCLKNEINKGK